MHTQSISLTPLPPEGYNLWYMCGERTLYIINIQRSFFCLLSGLLDTLTECLRKRAAAQLHGGHIVHTPPFTAAVMGVMERRGRGGIKV